MTGSLQHKSFGGLSSSSNKSEQQYSSLSSSSVSVGKLRKGSSHGLSDSIGDGDGFEDGISDGFDVGATDGVAEGDGNGGDVTGIHVIVPCLEFVNSNNCIAPKESPMKRFLEHEL